MTGLRRVIHGSGLRVANLVVSTVIGFFLMPFLVQHLGDRQYGFWVLAGAILGYYGVLDFGILSAVQFYVARALGKRDLDTANRTISTAFFTFAALGLLILLVTIVLAGSAERLVAAGSEVATFRSVLLIMGFGFAIGFPGRALLGAMCAHMRWDLVSQFNLGSLLLRTAAIVIAIRSGGGLPALAAITVFADVLAYTGYFIVLRRIQLPFHLSLALVTRPTFRELLGYSSFTFVAKIGDQLRFYIDGFVIGAFITVNAVTHYAVACRLATSFLELMVAIFGLLAPWFSLLKGTNNHLEIRRVFVFGTKLSAFSSTVVASLMIVYGTGFITCWMGISYLDAFWPLLVLTLAILIDVAQLPSVSYLYGVYRHRFLAYATIVEGVANVLLSIYLAPKYGIIGVALGTAIPLIAFKLLLQPVYVCRYVGLPLAEYYLGILGRPAAIAFTAVLLPAFFLSATISSRNLLQIVALAGAQLAIATVAGYFTVFGKDERHTIVRVMLQALRPGDKRAVECLVPASQA